MPFYPHLFAPLAIGGMTARNRLMMSAMSINFGVDDQNRITEQLTAYFEARARGGVGMMLVGGGGVHPSGVELPHLPALWDDAFLPSLAAMTARVKPLGARFGMQIMHGGRQSYHDQKVAPSAIPAPAVVKGVPRALSVPEIRELVAAFGDAARRSKDAGFDFIEVHGAHGYLINQFLSPNANRRTDAYGGPFENRIRFLLEVMDDIKRKTGDDFPVGIRINGNDYIQDGFTLEEAVRLARVLEARGADYLHVSAGVYGSTELTIPSMYTRHGCFVHLAEAVKQEVAIPVIAVGRIKDPELADRIIREQKADGVAMGRALLADPELPNKAREGRPDRIRPCIGCCLGCIHAVLQLEPGACVVNPDVGREYQLIPRPAPAAKRRVLVVGGGPAGMAAARMAALAGHDVLLVEGSGHLGGQLRLAAQVPGRGEVGDIAAFLQRELSRLGVEIRLNTAPDTPLLDAVAPETVILASGSLPELPVIQGLSRTAMHLATITDVLAGQTATGSRVIVLGGGGPALMLADWLAAQGKEVAVLNRRDHFAAEMSSNDRYYLRERLKKAGVALFKKAAVKAVLADGVAFACQGEVRRLEGWDTLVLAEKRTPNRDTIVRLRETGLPVHVIGDAKTPGILMHAISEAEEIGRAI